MKFSACASPRRRGPRILFLLLAALVSSGLFAAAGTVTWDADGTPGGATGGSGSWDASSLFWNSAGTMKAWNSASNDTALFGGSAGTVTLGGQIVTGGLLFSTTGYTFAGGGNTLTLGGLPVVSVANSGDSAVIQANVIVGSDAVFSGAGNLTLDGALSVAPGLVGAVNLTKIGAGTLTLTGTNNAALIGMTVSEGTLSIASSSNLTAGRVTLNGGTLQSTGTSTMSNGFNLGTAGGTIDVSTGQTLEVGTSMIRGHGSLVKTGNGTLQISIASTYLGSTAISAGTVSGGVGSFLPASTQVSIAAGAVLNLNGFGTTASSISGAGTITNTGGTAGLILGNLLGSQNTTFSGSFNATTPAALTLTKSSSGTLSIISATPGNATGTWTLNAGTVNVDYAANGSSTGNILNTRAMLLSGGNLQITGRNGATVAQTLGAITVGARGTQIIMVPNGGASTTLTLGTLLHPTTAGASLLVNAPAGTTVKTTTSGSTGTGIFGGRFVFTDGTNYNWATTTGTTPFAIAGYSGYGPLDTTSGADTVNSSLTGSAALAGVRTTNTLKISTSGSGQSLDLGAHGLALTGGGLLFTGANDYSISSTTGTLQSNTATTGDLIVHQYGTGTLTISAIIKDGTTGVTALTKAGAGTLVLSGVNTFTGGISVNNGTLSVNDNSQLGSALASTAITINDGATFRTTANMTIPAAGAGSHTFALTGGNANFDVANGTTLVVGGLISGVGGLTLSNTGTLQIATSATYTGPTYIGAGATLKGGVASFISSSTGGVLTVATGGTVDLNGFALGVGGIGGGGTITNTSATAATITIGSGTIAAVTGLNSTFSGILSGPINLSKHGSGALTFTNPAAYTGTTAVGNGAVIFGVDNALPATSLTVGNSGGPATSLVDLNGYDWSSGAITFYGTSTGNTSQATINIGDGGVLTLGGTLTLSLSTVAANSGLPAFITGGTLDLPAARSFAINDSPNAAVDLTITSNITSAGGAFSLTKTGTGTMVLAGNVNIGGSIAASVGVLETKGTVSTGAGATGVGSALIGTLRLPGGTQFSTTTMSVGTTANFVGSLVINGGALSTTTTNTQSGIAFGSGGYGGIFLSAGSVATNRVDTGDGPTAAAISVLQISGGTMSATEYLMTRNQRWEVTMTGGEFQHSTSGGLALAYRGTATAVGAMTVAGGLVNNAGFSVTMGQQNNNTALATVRLNLNAGTLITNNILHYNGSGAATTSTVNFNGGLLKAAAATTSFVAYTSSGGTGSMTAYVNGPFGTFNGGAVIDSNGFNLTIPVDLNAPTGDGVSSIPLTAGGSGYIGAPYVEISGGGGTGATASAVVDLDPNSANYGKVLNIFITNPGVGYTSAPTVTLLGGGGTGATLGTATTAANTSGGLTKSGNGVLTLSGGSHYGGATTVNGGTLVFGALANTLSGGIFINNGTVTGGANNNTFGVDANLITLGAASGSANATLGITHNNGVVKQPILVKGGNTGVATLLLGVGSTATTWESTVTLDNHALTIGKTGTTTTTGTLTGGITGTGNVTIDNTSVGGAITLSGSSINPAGTLTHLGTSSAGTLITAVIGSNVTSVVQNSAATSLTLGVTVVGTAQANAWSGGLIIKSGTVMGGANNNTFGADNNLITLGDTSGSANTTLGITFNSASANIKQPILVKGGNTGVATLLLGVGSTTTLWSSSVTLDNHDLTIGKTGSTSSVGTLSGGITGTGNLTIRGTSNQGGITLSGSAINPVGWITNTGTTIGSTTISAVIGSNVTDVTQNSASSPFVISGTAANTYTGTTSVLAGIMDLGKTTGVTAIPGGVTLGNGSAAAVLRLLNSNQIADTSVITFTGAGATVGVFRLNNKSETLGGLSSTGGAGIVENESGSAVTSTLTVNVASGSPTFSGLLRDGNGVDIDGTLALAKIGSGTQILTGSNTYTGVTLIQAGVLQIGSGGLGKTGLGAVSLQNGGTLSGTGVVQGIAFTAESGSTLHVGDGTAQSNYGTLTIQPASGSGVFDFQAASTIQLGIDPGGTSDLLKFMGLGTNTLLFNGNLTVTAGLFTPVSEEVFNLLDWSGLTNAPTFANRYAYTGMLFGNGDEAAGLDLPDVYGSGYAWDISNFITDGSIALISIVPEPSRALLLGLALSLVLARRRRPAIR